MNTNRIWKRAVGTVKKSTETSCLEWFFRNVRQVCDGGFGCRTKYLLTDDSETLIPNFKSSLQILGAPQPTLSRLIVRIRSRVSSEHEAASALHVEPSKSSTNGNLDGANL